MKSASNLISAIYNGTLAPENFGATFDLLDEILFPHGEDGAALGGVKFASALFLNNGQDIALTPDVIHQIETARSIQARVGSHKPSSKAETDLLESIPNPSFLIEGGEDVVGLNTLARTRHPIVPQRLEQCVSDARAYREIRDFLNTKDEVELFSTAGYFDLHKRTQTSLVVKRIDASVFPGRKGRLFLLTIVDFGFDSNVQRLFRETYGLTQTEAEIAVLLAGGTRLKDIATTRKVSMATLRTQVKLLKSKTSAADIPGLVRLLCGFAAGILAPTGAPTVVSTGFRKPLGIGDRRFVVLRDGRRLEYREQGAPKGEPVLLLHGVPYGAELPAMAAAEARKLGLRLISPYRPGYADTDNLDATGEDAFFDEVARDWVELLDHLDLDKVLVLSHGISAAYALRFTHLYSERVSHLMGISRAPIWRDEWLEAPPKRRRFLLRLAKYAPQLLPVVAWKMIACLEHGYASEFISQWVEEDSTDTAASKEPEILQLITRGTLDAMRHGTDGFCRECALSMKDMVAEAQATPHKFHFLSGVNDDIVRPDQIAEFANAVPGTTLETIPGAGHLLFFTHWREILNAITLKLR